MFASGTTDLKVLASSFDGQYSEEAIRQKLLKFGLFKEEQKEQQQPQAAAPCCCSSKLELPDELPSVEETLKTLAAALKALEAPGLKREDILRLRGIISGAKIYKELLADYINYRGLEAELSELREKYEILAKKTQGTLS